MKPGSTAFGQWELSLVIVDRSYYIWQSFNYPRLKLMQNPDTGLDKYLTSWKCADDPYPGDFPTWSFERGRRKCTGAARETTSTRTRRIVGTYGYMAPEYGFDGKFSI
ncbi:hypothetical protein ACP275_08G214700 [Erythranthe tilingii]